MKSLYIIVMLSFFILSNQVYAQVSDITTGIISHWTFDETNGTVAVNSANANFNATIENMAPGALTWLPLGGAIGGAAQFDGSGGCFRTPLYNLEVGEYLFNVTVRTNNDIPYNASVKVTVVPCSDMVTVNAGPDLKITLPTNSAEIID